MIFFLACFVAMLLVESLQAQNCNICGDDNSLQNPQGVVEFVYQGTKVKNNCMRWQEVVENENTISDEFCRTEMLQYTKNVCRCTTPEGDLLTDLTSPTIAPTPSSVFVQDGAIIDGNNDTDAKVVSKCEQTSSGAGNCNDSVVKDTSSAKNKVSFRFIGVFAFVTGFFVLR